MRLIFHEVVIKRNFLILIFMKFVKAVFLQICTQHGKVHDYIFMYVSNFYEISFCCIRAYYPRACHHCMGYFTSNPAERACLDL